jgi:predicted MFS family arabinose efflux permease
MLIAAVGMFGLFLFLTYYLQQTLGFSPVITGVAFLPMVACIMASSITCNIVLMPRTGPRPLVPAGMLLAAGGLALLTRIGVHSSYATAVLPSLLMMGLGLGLVFAPVFNTGTFGVPPADAGVASATVNTGQQLGGSIGTSLLNTIFASAVASSRVDILPATGHPALVFQPQKDGKGRPGLEPQSPRTTPARTSPWPDHAAAPARSVAPGRSTATPISGCIQPPTRLTA